VKYPFGNRNFLIILFGTLAVLPTMVNQYTLFVSNLVMIYIILALGLNLLIGYAGQLAFANAAMFGIGAYGCGLLQVKLGIPFFVAAPSGAVIAMVIGMLMAFPALRLSGIYLALATLAFAVLKIGLVVGWWVQAEGQPTQMVLTEATPPWAAGVAVFASIVLLINCVLFVFNLFPVPPLDGASVVAGLGEWGRTYRDTLRSSFSFVGIVVAWVLFRRVFEPFYGFVVSLL